MIATLASQNLVAMESGQVTVEDSFVLLGRGDADPDGINDDKKDHGEDGDSDGDGREGVDLELEEVPERKIVGRKRVIIDD